MTWIKVVPFNIRRNRVGGFIMDEVNKRISFFTVKKDVVVAAIKNSKKELQMLGTTAIELPWQENNCELYKTLYQKYCNGKYEISIMAESDPTLYSDALISGFSNNGAGVPIATLTETRQNSTSKLRNYFMKQNSKISGLEPVEDCYRKKLDALYTEKYAQNICMELENRGYKLDIQFGLLEDEESDGILNRIQKICMEKANRAFEESEVLSFYLKKGKYYQIGRVKSQYEEEIEGMLKEKLNKIQCASKKSILLFKFASQDLEYIFIDEEINKTCCFVLSSREVQELCLNSILGYLETHESRDYNIIREYASKEAYSERLEQLKKYEENIDTKQRFVIKQIFHHIPVQMLKVDDVYYAAISPLPSFDVKKFLYVGNSALSKEEDLNRFEEYDEYVRYFNVFMNSNYCTEETSKGNRKEIIYNYTSNRSVIGQMPRDSFYGSDNYKLVMWALIFDRKGQILIHKRSQNAKDNQGMWDKSVGGHIAIKDRDIITGASREIAEELYTVEEEEQGHTRNTGWTSVNEDKIIYLGKWNETRYPNFANNLHLESDEFYSFSFDSRMTEQPIDSMRVLPNGTHIKAKCFANLYFVVTSEEFDLSELKNSSYLVMKPHMIKECAKKGEITEESANKIREENPELKVMPGRFEVTPDLSYMINSPEWDNEITKFSIRVKEAFADKDNK